MLIILSPISYKTLVHSPWPQNKEKKFSLHSLPRQFLLLHNYHNYDLIHQSIWYFSLCCYNQSGWKLSPPFNCNKCISFVPAPVNACQAKVNNGFCFHSSQHVDVTQLVDGQTISRRRPLSNATFGQTTG